MKVYVAPDPENDGKPDFQAWFKAYGEYFNNESVRFPKVCPVEIRV